MENINSGPSIVSIYEYLGDEVIEEKTISGKSGDSFILHLPNYDNFNYRWYRFEWTIEKRAQEILPVVLVSQGLIPEGKGSYKIDFYNFTSKPVTIKVIARAEKYTFSILKDTFKNLKQGVVSMDNNYNSPILTLYPKQLNLSPGKADSIEIESPNSLDILDVFFIDSSGNNNKKTALTGKQYITSTKWVLSFHNTDPNSSANLNFFVSTLPY
ncbi:hypothetical protein [Bacillus halotolerans]|uniref:hypothetical protein n=1 Tax=Bacillus halotolerans TaxID=260554 RepID=UPI00222F2915|nr:hypothetical protein [Bacillus halotolerans]UZD52674.1 hypothetical protein OMK57_06565 [Bacillus halotolerans]